MNRRDFHGHLVAAASLPVLARAAGALPHRDDWGRTEALSGGRLGVAVLQGGAVEGHRLDERFPMCSTFKWLAAAFVLDRVDRGLERLDRNIAFGPDVLLPHSPVTREHVGAGMPVGALCEAAITVSDNAAANLILATFDGPQGLTAYARGLGDHVTRLDRREPQLNEGAPGDPRDTTTPRAMASLLHACVLGEALSPRSREQLARWLEASQTDARKLRAQLPPGWRLGSKTGSGGYGSSNDVGVFWPRSGPPVVVAVYITQTTAPEADRDAAIAQVARRVVTAR